jgi:hypothetical protein
MAAGASSPPIASSAMRARVEAIATTDRNFQDSTRIWQAGSRSRGIDRDNLRSILAMVTKNQISIN